MALSFFIQNVISARPASDRLLCAPKVGIILFKAKLLKIFFARLSFKQCNCGLTKPTVARKLRTKRGRRVLYSTQW